MVIFSQQDHSYINPAVIVFRSREVVGAIFKICTHYSPSFAQNGVREVCAD